MAEEVIMLGWYGGIFLLIVAFAAFVISFVNHLGPVGVAVFRLRKLRKSTVESVRKEWLYDLFTVYGQLIGVKAKRRFALQPSSHLVYELAAELFFQVPDEVAEDDGYRDWFGVHTYELFTVLLADDVEEHAIVEKLDRMIAADIQDYDTFYGYCEAAGTEAALLAFEYDIPIEYAKAMT